MTSESLYGVSYGRECPDCQMVPSCVSSCSPTRLDGEEVREEKEKELEKVLVI